jgi:hypothetical protein
MDPGILGSDFVIRPSKNDGKFEIGLMENLYSSDLSLAAHRVREVYYDREEGITVFACHGVDTVGTEITMHHNFANMDQSIIDKLNTNDTLHVQAWMCSQFENSIVSEGDPFTISDVVFTDAPGLNFGDVDSYIGYWDQNPDTRMIPTAPDSIDLTYSNTEAAYTAAVGGFPLGDLNWFPDKKAEWVTAIDDDPTRIAASFELSQNYPNPFNPSTNINFSIPIRGMYSLNVYNISGQKVATLINGQLTPGTQDITFDASNLSSGVYFYNLTGTNVNITKKMVLMK